MYSTCLFCHSHLGRNEAIEHLPVGRQLAFDPLRGRLWVVCPSCARWNLAPFEERWEALEECEKAFRETPLRYSTENIGLARHREGLDLVRIGRPRRPEFAGWRYGDEFVRRNRRMLPLIGLGMAIPAGALAAQFAGLIGAGLAPILINVPTWFQAYHTGWKPVVRVPDENGEVRVVRGKRAREAWIRPARGGGGWEIHVPRRKGFTRVERPLADRVLPRLVAHVNMGGARRKRVREALIELDAVGYGERYTDHLAASPLSTTLGWLPSYKRLALEMAAHESDERRALEGDLANLEAAWREAEEIAAIADRLPGPPPDASG